MSKLSASAFLISAILLAFSMAAEPTRSTPRAQRFSSVYTDFKRDCKSALTKKEEKEAEARGTDIPERCKGYGGYYVDVSYSAMASSISVMMKDEQVTSFGMQALNYTDVKGRKMEWRLADGQPFAVILRVVNYKTAPLEGGETPFDDKFKTGESLIVKGLKGYEKIDFTVDTKSTPNPNEKARQLADENYKK